MSALKIKEILTLINRKGGNGKTTTTSALAAGFRSKGYRVLTIDLDGQCSISHIMKAKTEVSILDVLTNERDITEAIQHTDAGDIIGANPGLDMADMQLTEQGRELLLKNVLKKIRDDYDLIVLDTLPAFGVLTLNSLAAASGVIIPSQADILSLNALKQTYDLIQSARQVVNTSLIIHGILITRYNQRSILNRDLVNTFTEAATKMKTCLFETKIRESVIVKEAQAKQQDIFTYASQSNPAKDYKAFVDELEFMLSKKNKKGKL